MATVTSPMTADEYINLPDRFEGPTELVKGVLVQMPPTRPRHGEICLRIGHLLLSYLDRNPIGRAVSNDAGILTERDPDTVRGADIAYYSYGRVPQGPLPPGLLNASPELVFEVLSPSDRWSEVQLKVAEYLTAGVTAVCVVDDTTRSVHIFRADQPMQIFKATDAFSLPDILSDFRVDVRKFFE